jgi:hypothetical protein
MKKKTIEKIKSLCSKEVKFVSSEENSVTMLFPYSTSEIDIEIEGNTVEEQVESFISEVNKTLEDMINHLEDCKIHE